MTDKVQRPLSADVADKFTRASQERGKALVGDQSAGVLLEAREYRIESPEGNYYIGEVSYRTAMLCFSDRRRNRPDSFGPMVLTSRPIEGWTTVATEETLDDLENR